MHNSTNNQSATQNEKPAGGNVLASVEQNLLQKYYKQLRAARDGIANDVYELFQTYDTHDLVDYITTKMKQLAEIDDADSGYKPTDMDMVLLDFFANLDKLNRELKRAATEIARLQPKPIGQNSLKSLEDAGKLYQKAVVPG